MKYPNSKAGFAHVGLVLLIVLILGVVGGGGYYIWHKNHEKKTASSASSSQNSQSSTPANGSTTGQSTTRDAADLLHGEAVATTYSEVPAALQRAIFATTVHDASGCIKGGQIVDFNGKPTDQTVFYAAANGSAFTGIGCDGGANYLFVKEGEVWRNDVATQMGFSCPTLRKDHVPLKLLELATRQTDCFRDTKTSYNNPIVKYEDFLKNQ